MSNKEIRSIVTVALVAWADTKGIPVAREGMSFTPPENHGTFIQLSINPADTIIAALDGTRQRYVGDVMCNIFVKSTLGTGLAETLADEIATLFPAYPKNYLPVSVETTPHIKRSIVDDSGYRITPVCFSYRAEY